MKKVTLVIGTRPEAIKMGPVYHALKALSGIKVTLVSTGQHRDLLDQAMNAFDLIPDFDLRVMRQDQSLSRLTGAILDGLDSLFSRSRPDLILGHGDTSTCFSVALSSFYHRIPMAHVESGLRTHNLDSPFPEEFNRQSVARVAELHFAPCQQSRENLLREGVKAGRITVTGTTAIDAVRHVMARSSPSLGKPGPTSTITLHRRENGGEKLYEMLLGIKDAATLHPEMTFVYPVHPNPQAQNAAYDVLSKVPNIHLTEPMEYGAFIGQLARSKVILTDSGGIQEEASLLGKRVLILREHTERSNGLSEGSASIIGTSRHAVAAATSKALAEASLTLEGPCFEPSPSDKIAEEVRRRLA